MALLGDMAIRRGSPESRAKEGRLSQEVLGHSTQRILELPITAGSSTTSVATLRTASEYFWDDPEQHNSSVRPENSIDSGEIAQISVTSNTPEALDSIVAERFGHELQPQASPTSSGNSTDSDEIPDTPVTTSTSEALQHTAKTLSGNGVEARASPARAERSTNRRAIPRNVTENDSPADLHHAEGNNLRGGSEPRESDVFIAVMGVTGSGKSTFISKCTDAEIQIGHNLQACTQEVSVYRHQYSPETSVYLVDTPGFDDTNRSDTEVLREVATWLTQSYSRNIRLNGIVYLHRITDLRMQGSAKRNLLMFRKLCGPDALKNVILCTSMWERVSEAEGAQREAELIETDDFWGWMSRNGSQVRRHTNDSRSALNIVSVFASSKTHNKPIALQLQEEMVDQTKSLNETEAGLEVEGAIAQERERSRKELEELRREMEQAKADLDKETSIQLQLLEEEMQNKISQLDRQHSQLATTMTKLHKEKYKKIEARLRDARRESQRTREAFEKAEADQKAQQRQDEEERRSLIKSLERREKEYERFQHQLQELEAKDKSRETELARLRQQAKEARAAERKKKEELTELMRAVQLKETKAKRSTESTAAQDRDYSISLALSGDYYCFVGIGPSYYQAPFQCQMHEILHFAALGTNNAWVRCYTKFGKRRIEESGNFREHYPSAFEILHERDFWPSLISLGADDRYFISTPEMTYWSVPSSIRDEVRMNTVSRMWLGMDDSFIAVTDKGDLSWNLRGHYGKLEKWLQKRRRRYLMAAALNLEDPSDFLCVSPDRRVHGSSSIYKTWRFKIWSFQNV